MADLEVTRIGSAPGDVEPLTHVGIAVLGGRGWRWTREEVAQAIEHGVHTFYVVARGMRLQLAVIRGGVGNYVRCHDGHGWTDDLLALPRYAENRC